MDKSYVTMEQHICMVCGVPYDTGNLLLDRRFFKRFERHTVTGHGLCPEHEKLFNDGYLAIVAIDPEKSSIDANGTVKPGDAHRTGSIAHIKRDCDFAREHFPTTPEQVLVYADEELIKLLQSLTKD